MNHDEAKEELEEGDVLVVTESKEGNWLEGARLKVEDVSTYDPDPPFQREAEAGDIRGVKVTVLNPEESTREGFNSPASSLKPKDNGWWAIPSAVSSFGDRVKVEKE